MGVLLGPCKPADGARCSAVDNGLQVGSDTYAGPESL